MAAKTATKTLRQVLAEEVLGADDARRAARVRGARFALNTKSFASWKPALSPIDMEVQKVPIPLEWARRKETVVFAGPSRSVPISLRGTPRGRETGGGSLADAGPYAVASRITTASVRDMIEALIAGERDPKVLAGFARGRMREKPPR